MRVSLYGTTDVGRVRSSNEDGFVLHDLDRRGTIDPPAARARPVGRRGVLLAVCDGMGGHAAGEVASSLALETLEEEMERLKDTCPRPDLMKEAVTAVNERVWQEARLHPKLAGMGTTLTSLWFHGGRVYLAHVGDSRAYLFRDGRTQQLSDEVAPELRTTLEQARKTLGAAQQVLATDSPAQGDLRETLQEVTKAAETVRSLADYLERHPESLIRGKRTGDDKK